MNERRSIIYIRAWVVYCGMFLSALDTGIVTVALKPMATIFGVSLPVVGLTVTFYLFALIAMLIPGGWLGDRFGCERLLAYGFAIFGGASLICGSSLTIAWLIFGRALQGIGAALIQGNALGYVARQTPDSRLHMSTMITAALGIGPILGPSLGGLLMELGSWPCLFLVNLPFCIAGFFISLRGHQVKTTHAAEQLDGKGLSLFALLVALAAWLLYLINTNASLQNTVVTVLLISVITIIFARYELQHRVPFIPVAALAQRTPAFLITASFVLGYGAGVYFTTAPVALLDNRENALSTVGIIISAAPTGFLIGAFIRRRMFVRFGDLEAMRFGSLMMFGAFLLFAVPMTMTKSALFAACAVFFGVGGGVFQVSSVKNAFRITPKRPSMAGALQRLFRNLGIAFGATVALYMLQHGRGSATSPFSGTSVPWISAAFFCLSCLCLSVFQDARHYHS